jgi:hypothetical protein
MALITSANTLVNPNDYKLYFDEEKHKYYDDFNNPLTSVTTIIKKYEHETDWNEIARNCWKAGLKGNPKYKGKTAEQLLIEWGKTSKDALAQGNEKHNFLEVAVKDSSQFYKFHTRHPGNNRRLYTIPEVKQHPGYGELSLDTFVESGVRDRYPAIYTVIETLVNAGYRIYSEIGAYNVPLLVTGLIDILLIRGNSFIILDWKTNKAPIRFDSGYWEKDASGILTGVWSPQDHMFKFPVNKLPCSIGNKYALQLSIYAYLVMQFGLKCEGLILCQIVQNDNGTETVKIEPYPMLIKEADAMLAHHVKQLKPNKQHSLLLF